MKPLRIFLVIIVALELLIGYSLYSNNSGDVEADTPIKINQDELLKMKQHASPSIYQQTTQRTTDQSATRDTKPQPTPTNTRATTKQDPRELESPYKEWKEEKAAMLKKLQSERTPRKGKAVVWETAEDVESMSVSHLLVMYNEQKKAPKDERVETISKLLRILSDWMTARDMTHWLTHGTLLGSFRDKKIIPWDLDADLAFDYEAHMKLTRLLAIESTKNTSPEELFGCAECQMVAREGKHSYMIPFKFANTTNGVYVDLILFFPTEDDKSVIMFWPTLNDCFDCRSHKERGGFQVKRYVIFPLASCEFEGRNYPCPQKAEEYLKMWYRDLKPPPKMQKQYLAGVTEYKY